MSPIAIPLHFLLPLALGALVGSSWRVKQRVGRACAIAGAVFGMLHFGVVWLVDLLWIPPVESPMERSEFVAEALAFALGYVAICIVLSMVAGHASSTLAGWRPDGDGTAESTDP